jgi:Protein of unknown function (DUF3237)
MQTAAIMSASFNDNLPDNLKNIRARPMFVMRLDVAKPLLVVGPTPVGHGRTCIIRGGFFEGDRLSGKVLDGGSDWQTVRPDGSVTLNVKLILRTNDNALVSRR